MFRSIASRLINCTPLAVANRLSPSISLSSTLSKITSSGCKTLPGFFHTSSQRPDIMEFFDEKENWGKDKVRVGRSWSKDELRLKSNSDLHKLWFVLLKERNMLLTMEEACKQVNENMPNPERIDKVEDSMENLEHIVRERNRAYYELETTESGERERYLRPGAFGYLVGYKDREHVIPWKLNSSYREKLRLRFHTTHGKEVRSFLALYTEQLSRMARHQRLVQMRLCAHTLRRFPDADEDALREKFPMVSVALVKRWKKSLSHGTNAHVNV